MSSYKVARLALVVQQLARGAVHGAVWQKAGANDGHGAALQPREALQRRPAVPHCQQRLGRPRAPRPVPIEWAYWNGQYMAAGPSKKSMKLVCRSTHGELMESYSLIAQIMRRNDRS